MAIINSLTNPKIKELVRLRQAHQRRAAGLFIIDGYREIALAQAAGWGITDIFYCPQLIKKGALSSHHQSTALTEVSAAVFQKICYKDKPDGWLALARRQALSLSNIQLSDNPLIIILESVEKPGNLGAIIRTAAAAGVELIIINDSQTDLFNANVIRSSEGLIFQQKLVQASVAETQAWLKLNKIHSLSAATTGQKIYTEARMTGSLAVVLGSEADGLSQDWLKSATELVKIPMHSGLDSLNVSVAAAIIIYEALRQRGWPLAAKKRK